MDETKNRQTTKSIFDSEWAGREFGKYRALKLLSQHESRQTVTLQAINQETNETVVLKKFGSVSEKSKKEFEKEIAAFKKLKSKHGVLMPLETFEQGNDYFIVTEYKNGGDLRKWLKTKPKITETLNIFAQIAESIDYVHENRIIHRDIKPENIVYEVSGEKITPYIIDFGISVMLSDTTSSFITKHGFGTIEYMAPEFFLHMDGRKTKAVDNYAFGLMLYEALEGYHPFTGNTAQETIAHIISGVMPVPKNTIKRLGENAGLMLTRALSKNPEDRPKTATEIISQIESQYIKYIGSIYGKYVIEAYIGRGPHGATYKAYDSNNKNKKVALKLLSVPRATLPEISDLKILEQNKGILPIIDIGHENGVHYLAAEYLNGYNLRHILSPKGVEIQEILKILKPLSETLDYLHEKAIVHRDLKPENILLRKNRTDGSLQPFVNDYGISKVVETTDIMYANSNILLGNFNYLAPEILENRQPSPATDVYSLGVIVYEAIEGKTPFDAKSLSALIKQKSDDYVPTPRNLLKSGGTRAVRVLLKALSVKPEQRQSSASDLVSQLEAAVRNRSTAPKFQITELLEPTLQPFVSFVKKYRWPIALLLVIALWAGSIPYILAFRPTYPQVVTIAPVIPTTQAVPISIVAPVKPVASISSANTPVSSPPFEPSSLCTLPDLEGENHDYTVPGHLLLEDVYRQKFGTEPDSNDLYAIAYYNNRKILEGYSKYHVIDPISLDVRRDWKIFIPPLEWIEGYKQLPSTIPLQAQPQSTQTGSQSKLDISGSSILSNLSTQLSSCASKTTGIKLAEINSGNTVSGLRDICQGKVDLFGANKEIDAAMMIENGCNDIELEKFEVARYAMVILINKNNPNADDIQNNHLTNEELKKLLIDASSWMDVRDYWKTTESIVRHYPSLQSGEFEIIKNGIFPDRTVYNVPGLNINNDKQSLISKIVADVNAVGVVDYDSYQDNENKNQLIAIAVNDVHVRSAITSDNGYKYPLMTTLYLYAEKHAYETDDTLRSFINYYLSHELDFLDELGYLCPSRKGYMGNPGAVP